MASSPPRHDIHDFDIWDEEKSQDIFGIFAEMVRSGPAVRAETYGGYWVVAQYDAVRAVLQDWQTFTSEQGVQYPPVGGENQPPITVDPPVQTAYRRFLSPYFTPAAVTKLEPAIRTHVDDLIDTFIEAGHTDLSEDFAEPLVPLVFFEDVLHVPADLIDRFMTRMLEPGSTPVEHVIAAADICRDLVAYRRTQPPRGDVVDAVFNATIGGRPLNDEDVSGVIELLLLGGTDTTRKVIASALQYLAEHPDTRTSLVAKPELMEAAAEEFLRLWGSVQTVGRTATRDVSVGDQHIPAGGKVLCALAGADRDPAEFDRPDTFDLDRRSNRHFAFGVGPHRCLGSNLARLEIRLALEGVISRMPDYRIAEGWQFRRRRGFVHGPESLPVTFTPGPRKGDGHP
jgi:cytochrome P450